MKLFVVHTHSVSGDDYYYVLKHPKTPTDTQLLRWLSQAACDKNDETCFESIREVTEVEERYAESIPKTGKILEFI